MGATQAIVQSAFTTRYSDEFRVDVSASNRLTQLASMKPRGGQSGALLDLSTSEGDPGDRIDFFRSGLRSLPTETNIWPLMLVLGATLLLFDVANRRLAWTGLQSVSKPFRKSSPRRTP